MKKCTSFCDTLYWGGGLTRFYVYTTPVGVTYTRYPEPMFVPGVRKTPIWSYKITPFYRKDKDCCCLHTPLSGNKLRCTYHFDHTFANVISLARRSTSTYLRQKGKSFSFFFSFTKWRLITRILSYADFSPNAIADFLFSQMSMFF